MTLPIIGLGTMTYGEQNTEEEAFAQLDYALEHGVDFIDTAELYPVPPREETATRTEAILGRWLEKRKCRDRVVLATKITGRAQLPWFRNGPRLSPAQIKEAVDSSLKRLKTEWIDLYQLHWPDRTTNYFGQLDYTHIEQEESVPIDETLGALGELVQEGKIRHIGISNESPWGLMQYLRLSEERGLPRVASIQNPYSLLNRSFEVGLAEMAIREDVGLLAYSPLGFGILSGKYVEGRRPPGARMTRFGDHFTRYTHSRALRATARYVKIAKGAGLDPAVMAIAFACAQRFVTSVLIGATTMEQLETNVKAANTTLRGDVVRAIEEVHRDIPNPAP